MGINISTLLYIKTYIIKDLLYSTGNYTQYFVTIYKVTLWEKARVGCFKRTAWKHVYYLGWNRSPAQVGCMRQALRPGALGKPRGSGWRGRWEEGSGWETHINPWLFHFNVWQNPPQIKKKSKKEYIYVYIYIYKEYIAIYM